MFEEQRKTEIAFQIATKKEKELEVSIRKVADAERYKAEQEAESEKFKRIRDAEAEAEAMKIKAEAYKEYGEAAMITILAEKLPEIAKAIAEPLSKTDKMVIIDNGGEGGASRVSKNITKIMAEVPEVINSLTGIDLIDVVKGFASKDKNNSNIHEIINNISEEDIVNFKENILASKDEE